MTLPVILQLQFTGPEQLIQEEVTYKFEGNISEAKGQTGLIRLIFGELGIGKQGDYISLVRLKSERTHQRFHEVRLML